jgi:hypothetical protein
VVATGGSEGSYRRYSFDAAPGRIGLMHSRLSLEPDSGLSDPSAGVLIEYHSSRLLAGRTPRRLTRVARCAGVGSSFPYAVGSAHVAFARDCPASDLDEAGSRQLRYLDLSGATPRRRALTVAGGRFMTSEWSDSLRVAGPWLAVDATVSGTAHTLVYDLVAGGEAYRVARPSGWALDGDGNLVTVSGDPHRCATAMAFHAPADPAPHPLPYRACSPAVEVDAGRILFIGEAGGRRALMLGALDGAAPRPLAWRGGLIRSFDIEAGRIAYGRVTCGRATEVRVASVDEPETGPPPGRRRCRPMRPFSAPP